MTNKEMLVKLTAIMENEAVFQTVCNAETQEEMQAIFARNGLEMTLEEIDMFIDTMNEMCASEVEEDDLENVVGGSGVSALWVFSKAWKYTKKIAKACWKAGRWFANNVC